MSGKNTEKPRISIAVADGFVHDVYTTLDDNIEVDILDFDNARVDSPEAEAELAAYERIVQHKQRQIYKQ